MPAQSPTLSPTLSAMVAALRGSSSGMPASILPTRSAPTSAALVKMPPPTRMNRAMSEPPKPKPMRMAVAVFWNSMMMTVAPSRPRPTVNMPATPPERKATVSALGNEPLLGRRRGAHVALHGQAHADEAGEARQEGTGDEGERAEDARLRERQRGGAVGLGDLGGGEEHHHEQRDEDHGDRLELTPEVGHGPLLDGTGDLLHLRGAGIGGEHATAKAEADDEGEHRGRRRGEQPEPLGTAEVERLVPPFAGEDMRHALASFLGRFGVCDLADEDLAGDLLAHGAVMALDEQHERAVERVLLPHLDAHARAQAEGVEEGDHVGVGRAGHGDDGRVARLEAVERGHLGDVGRLGRGDREAVGAGRRAVEGDEQPVLDLLGQLVLEGAGQPVGLVPGVAEHVGEEALDDAVAADGGHRRPAPDEGELDAAVGPVVGQAPVGQALHGGRHRARAHAQGVGQVAGVGLGAVCRRDLAVDGLQRFALGLREDRFHGFAAGEPSFWPSKTSSRGRAGRLVTRRRAFVLAGTGRHDVVVGVEHGQAAAVLAHHPRHA